MSVRHKYKKQNYIKKTVKLICISTINDGRRLSQQTAGVYDCQNHEALRKCSLFIYAVGCKQHVAQDPRHTHTHTHTGSRSIDMKISN